MEKRLKKILGEGWIPPLFFVSLGMKKIKKIFAFEDSFANLAAYEKLNFSITEDDAANGIFYAEADLTDYDWLAVLGLLEDCKRLNVQPILDDNGKFVYWEDAITYADQKASEEALGLERIKN